MKTNYTFWAALLVALVFFTTCIKDQEPIPDVRSGLNVVNSFLEAQAVLHRLDVGRGLQRLDQGQGYRGVDYFTVPSYAACRLEIISSNESAQLVDTTFALEENKYYTSFLFGTEAAPKHFVTADRLPDGTEDPTATAGLRFFNLAQTSQRVTLYVETAEPIAAFRNRPTETPETGKEAEEFTLTANTGTFVLTVQDEDGNQLAKRTGVALDPGEYLTAFLTGDGNESTPYYIGIVRHRGVN